MMVERRHFEHFSHRHIHLARQRNEVAVAQATIEVVQLVQIFNQKIAAVWPRTDEVLHLGHGRMVGLATLELVLLAQAATQLVNRNSGNGRVANGGLGSHSVVCLAAFEVAALWGTISNE